jgi:excisionase family DNA binding protein
MTQKPKRLIKKGEIKIGGVTIFELKEVAQKFSISMNTARRYVREGRLSGQKLGQKWYVSEHALDEFFLKPYVRPKKKTRI